MPVAGPLDLAIIEHNLAWSALRAGDEEFADAVRSRAVAWAALWWWPHSRTMASMSVGPPCSQKVK